jgi:superoxide dismutase
VVEEVQVPKTRRVDGGGTPEGELAVAIDEHLGSFEAFSKQVSNATATVQGSGWADGTARFDAARAN